MFGCVTRSIDAHRSPLHLAPTTGRGRIKGRTLAAQKQKAGVRSDEPLHVADDSATFTSTIDCEKHPFCLFLHDQAMVWFPGALWSLRNRNRGPADGETKVARFRKSVMNLALRASKRVPKCVTVDTGGRTRLCPRSKIRLEAALIEYDH
jgi:hypothetical protein